MPPCTPESSCSFRRLLSILLRESRIQNDADILFACIFNGDKNLRLSPVNSRFYGLFHAVLGKGIPARHLYADIAVTVIYRADLYRDIPFSVRIFTSAEAGHALYHGHSSRSPLQIRTAGPCMKAVPSSEKDTVTSPPGIVTRISSPQPMNRRAAAAALQAPVPQASVFPAPRSHVLHRI